MAAPNPIADQLTAYLHGELPVAAAEAVRQALAADPALRQEAAELQAVMAALEQGLPPAADAPTTLTEERRVAVLQAAAAAPARDAASARPLRLTFVAFRILAAAAVVVLVAGVWCLLERRGAIAAPRAAATPAAADLAMAGAEKREAAVALDDQSDQSDQFRRKSLDRAAGTLVPAAPTAARPPSPAPAKPAPVTAPVTAPPAARPAPGLSVGPLSQLEEARSVRTDQLRDEAAADLARQRLLERNAADQHDAEAAAAPSAERKAVAPAGGPAEGLAAEEHDLGPGSKDQPVASGKGRGGALPAADLLKAKQRLENTTTPAVGTAPAPHDALRAAGETASAEDHGAKKAEIASDVVGAFATRPGESPKVELKTRVTKTTAGGDVAADKKADVTSKLGYQAGGAVAFDEVSEKEQATVAAPPPLAAGAAGAEAEEVAADAARELAAPKRSMAKGGVGGPAPLADWRESVIVPSVRFTGTPLPEVLATLQASLVGRGSVSFSLTSKAAAAAPVPRIWLVGERLPLTAVQTAVEATTGFDYTLDPGQRLVALGPRAAADPLTTRTFRVWPQGGDRRLIFDLGEADRELSSDVVVRTCVRWGVTLQPGESLQWRDGELTATVRRSQAERLAQIIAVWNRVPPVATPGRVVVRSNDGPAAAVLRTTVARAALRQANLFGALDQLAEASNQRPTGRLSFFIAQADSAERPFTLNELPAGTVRQALDRVCAAAGVQYRVYADVVGVYERDPGPVLATWLLPLKPAQVDELVAPEQRARPDQVLTWQLAQKTGLTFGPETAVHYHERLQYLLLRYDQQQLPRLAQVLDVTVPAE